MAGRLESIVQNGIETARYQYDGNRTHINGQLIAFYNDQDRLLTYRNSRYSYTANGELESKTDNGITTQYRYDTFGTLIQVTLPGDIVIDYVIDGQNRRIGKQINGQLTRGFLYKDRLNPVAELNANGQIVSRFVYADKANVPTYLIKIDPATQTETAYRIISDYLGYPKLIVNLNPATPLGTWGA